MSIKNTTDKGMPQRTSKETWYLLEEQQPFSQSLLWDLQRHYFAGQGAEAWRQGVVPHYITSNPTMARSYAEIVFAFRQDQQRLDPDDEPLYICELGGGSGRFAFHFLQQLTRLCQQYDVALHAFRYVLTDFAPGNLHAWRIHPHFQTFFESGLLDVALFDVNHSEQLALQIQDCTLSTGTLPRPLVVIANYLFDSVPQDLFYFKDQAAHACLVSLATAEDPESLDVAELLNRLCFHYDYQPLLQAFYPEPELQELLELYRSELNDSHLLFPAAGLRCLQRLKALSKNGLILLSADKGEHRLERIARKSPPGLVCHGSFSLSVNYHAFQSYCRRSGGLAMIPAHRHQSIAVVCLLMLDNAEDYLATRRAYHDHVESFSPDDFSTLTRHLVNHHADMTVETILAYMRLSYYDAHQLARLLPRLTELAPDLSPEEIQELEYAMDKAWKGYFPLKEERDLAFAIGCFFYELNDFAAALNYFHRSDEIYGQHTGTLYNMASCHYLLNQPGQAKPLLQKVIETDPGNEAARELLNSLSTEDTGIESTTQGS